MVLEREGDLHFVGPRPRRRASVAVAGISVSVDIVIGEPAMKKKGYASVLTSAAIAEVLRLLCTKTSVNIIIIAKVGGQNNNGKSFNLHTYRA
jgi:ABC-type branched-subunit amino acid transport system permease subunit